MSNGKSGGSGADDNPAEGCLILVLLFGGTVLLTYAGLAFVGQVGALLSWLESALPGAPTYRHVLAVASVVALQNLIFFPFHLTHTRVNRDTGRVGWVTGKKATRREEYGLLGLSMLEMGVLGVLTVAANPIWAGEGLTFRWAQAGSLLYSNFWVGVGVSLLAFGLALGYMIAMLALSGLFYNAFLKFASGADGGFVRVKFDADTGKVDMGFLSGVEAVNLLGISALGLMFGWLFGWEHYFLRVVSIFLITGLLFRFPARIISLLLDRSSDRWVQGLGRQLVEGGSAEKRLEAAQKLERMGTWAAQAKGQIEAAQNDEDARIRACAQSALRRISQRALS